MDNAKELTVLIRDIKDRTRRFMLEHEEQGPSARQRGNPGKNEPRPPIAFNTWRSNRGSLTKRSIEPLLQPDKFDLHWCDGSKTGEGMLLPTVIQNKTPPCPAFWM